MKELNELEKIVDKLKRIKPFLKEFGKYDNEMLANAEQDLIKLRDNMFCDNNIEALNIALESLDNLYVINKIMEE